MLFASATIDYDYIMKLIADFSTRKPGKATMSRDELIGLIAADSKFIDEREDITEYVRGLKAGEGLASVIRLLPLPFGGQPAQIVVWRFLSPAPV